MIKQFEAYRRNCINIKMVLNDNCPHSRNGYCINCNEFVDRYQGKVPLQVEANAYFNKIVLELVNAIIDEAFSITYDKFRMYPNIQTINYMRMRFKSRGVINGI